MSREARLVIISVISTLVAVIMLQNMRSVTLRFVMWEMTVPLALFILTVFVGGALAGIFWRRR